MNYGDVTSGVIGNTKLYYDIWGDAVNIASRCTQYWYWEQIMRYQNLLFDTWYLIPDNISDTWCFTLLNFRMDSTGVEGRIQVNERTRDVLKQVSLTPPLSTVQLKIQSPKIPPSINVLQKCIVCNISVVWVWRAGRHLCEREGQHESVPLHKTEGECPQNVLKCFLLFQSPQFLASQG